MITCAREARLREAPVITISRFEQSPLVRLADYNLSVAATELIFRSGAMSSRISQLNMIDILYTAYVHKRYDECMEQFRKTHIAKSEGPDETKTYCKGRKCMIDLSVLVTESRNKETMGLDQMTPLEIVAIMNRRMGRRWKLWGGSAPDCPGHCLVYGQSETKENHLYGSRYQRKAGGTGCGGMSAHLRGVAGCGGGLMAGAPLPL